MANVWAKSMACHPRATCHIAGCNNSIRHSETRFRHILFCFFNAFWSLMIGGFRIVSDTLVIHVVLTVRCTKMLTQAKEYVVVIAESIAQTSIKAYNRNRKLSGIGIRISGLIRIRFRMSAGSLPKRCRFIILSTCRHFAECRENRPAAV